MMFEKKKINISISLQPFLAHHFNETERKCTFYIGQIECLNPRRKIVGSRKKRKQYMCRFIPVQMILFLLLLLRCVCLDHVVSIDSVRGRNVAISQTYGIYCEFNVLFFLPWVLMIIYNCLMKPS